MIILGNNYYFLIIIVVVVKLPGLSGDFSMFKVLIVYSFKYFSI